MMAAPTSGSLADWWDGLQQHLLDQGSNLTKPQYAGLTAVHNLDAHVMLSLFHN